MTDFKLFVVGVCLIVLIIAGAITGYQTYITSTALSNGYCQQVVPASWRNASQTIWVKCP